MHQVNEISNTVSAPRFAIGENVAATMSSLELVDFINANARRVTGDAVLQHKHFLAKVPVVLGVNKSAEFLADYRDGMNRSQKCYRFPKREACLMAMSYSYELQAVVFDHMTALEDAIKSRGMAGIGNSKIVGELAIMECYTRLLKPAPSSQIMMLAKISQNNGLDSNFLPAYAVDAASDSTDGSSMPTKSLTALLRDHGIKMSATAFNVLLGSAGYLKRLTRKNSKQEAVEFWSVTELGLRFGKNLTSPNNPRETQPHWYADRFADLAREVRA
jgi:hypothetical protein